MRYLLDAHSLLWFFGGDEQLSKVARNVIAETENILFVSIGTLWEIVIKHNIGKLGLSIPFDQLISVELDKNAIEILPLKPAHLVRYSSLPLIHRDPFDRLLVAQGLEEDMSLVTRDAIMLRYGVQVVW